jgi:recombinase
MMIAKYIRLSSADEDARYGDKPESNSVTNQRMLLNRYLETHPEFEAYQVLEFQDDGRSGTNFERPGIKAMLEMVRRREIDCVIVKDFSRFGRNYVEVGNYLEQVFPFLGVRFISVNDGYDSKDYPYGVAGDINNGLRNLINELYSRDLSQKVKDSYRQYTKRGQCVSAYPIYGYVKSPADRRLLIPDPEAADIVRRIFERCNAGEGPTQIASGLNRDGVPTPSQRKRDLGSKRQLWNSARLQNEWSDKAITRILRDERYTGKLIGIKTTRTELGNQKSSRKQSEEDWIVVPGTFEAIVSQETFDEAQRQLETLRRHSGKRETNTPAVHLFSRKLKCGHCGLALGRHVVDLGVYYHCERRAWNSGATCLGARLFEDDLIRTVLASIRFQARLAGKAEKRLDKLENAERRERESLWEQRRRIQMKLDHLTTQKAEAFLLFNQGDLTQKTYDAKCAKLDKTILEQRTKLLDMSGTQTGTQDGAVLHCREDIARLKELSNLRTLNRQTVEKLIQSIRVYDGKRIEIVWNFSDSYMKLLTGEEQNHEG